MSEIKISYTELENKIRELRSLRSYWENEVGRDYPESLGSGKTVIIADEVAKLYLKLYQSVCNLYDNSIEYLEKVNANVSNKDEEVADAFKE